MLIAESFWLLKCFQTFTICSRRLESGCRAIAQGIRWEIEQIGKSGSDKIVHGGVMGIECGSYEFHNAFQSPTWPTWMQGNGFFAHAFFALTLLSCAVSLPYFASPNFDNFSSPIFTFELDKKFNPNLNPTTIAFPQFQFDPFIRPPLTKPIYP